MVKVIKTIAMKWVLDGSRRVELIDNGVADKIAYNKSGGDVLHCTAREGDGSLRCISICNLSNFCSHPLLPRPSQRVQLAARQQKECVLKDLLNSCFYLFANFRQEPNNCHLHRPRPSLFPPLFSTTQSSQLNTAMWNLCCSYDIVLLYKLE